jgi:hypothetical protein
MSDEETYLGLTSSQYFPVELAQGIDILLKIYPLYLAGEYHHAPKKGQYGKMEKARRRWQQPKSLRAGIASSIWV